MFKGADQIMKQKKQKMSQEKDDQKQAEAAQPQAPADKPTAGGAQNGQPQAAKPPPAPPEESPAQPAASAQPGPSPKAEEPPKDKGHAKHSHLTKLEEELAAEKEKAADYYDKYLRLQAEFENYKRRIQKEQTDLLRYAALPLMKELAGVYDNLERAQQHAATTPDETVGALLEGVQMVSKQLREAYERHGMRRVEPQGQPFDPATMEAMGLMETDATPENHVAQVLQCGYLMHERVVKPAMVMVARPKAAPQPAAGENKD